MSISVVVPKNELYDERTNKFINIKETTLTLEHSLVSLHKWEQKWKKPFLKEGVLQELGPVAMMDYIKCMTINKGVDDNVYLALTEDVLKQVTDYINDPMTATWFAEDREKPKGRKKRQKEILTAEVIYWQMITLQIPKEFEKWHLNSLLTLIRVCGVKNEEQYNETTKGSKGKTKKPNLKSRAALNAKRRAANNSKG